MVKCKKCGAEADFVSGMEHPFDGRREQHHCPECHYTFITTKYGKFIKEGVLPEPVHWLDFHKD